MTEGWLGFLCEQSIRLALLELQFYSLGLALIQATNLITKKELLTTDPDTDDKQLIYEITTGPRNGHVENKMNPGTAVTTFTQGMELCPAAFFHQLIQFIKIRKKQVGGEKTRGRSPKCIENKH